MVKDIFEQAEERKKELLRELGPVPAPKRVKVKDRRISLGGGRIPDVVAGVKSFGVSTPLKGVGAELAFRKLQKERKKSKPSVFGESSFFRRS
jgi:hypothetical protein